MGYAPFHDYFIEVAKNETRSFFIVENGNVIDDRFALFELYCNDRNCDCRRVMFYVYSEKQKKNVAVIGFGWEPEKYYRKWCPALRKEDIEEMIGPSLNSMSPQSEMAPVILDHVKSILEKDRNYVDRIIRHYNMFRKKIDGDKEEKPRIISLKTGRNEQCPCGSGKKFKNCCSKN